jgi:hydrogenase/urease accessory protein HupE
VNRDTLLVSLTVTGSTLCWWLVIMEPNLRFPWWLPLTLIALGTALATAVSKRSWPHFVVVSVVGAFAGLCSGFAIWWPTDRLVPVPYLVFAATLAVTAVSLIAALAVRKVSLSDEKLRRAVGLVLVCCAAFGPVAVAVTPPLVAYRVARNDRAAAERFASLKNAVERTVAEGGDPGASVMVRL